MSRLVSIDPGKHNIGWASFEDDELYRCGLVIPQLKGAMWAAIRADFKTLWPEEIVVEVPQIYQQRRMKGDPNDNIDVALVAGMAAHELAGKEGGEVTFIRPRAWKGQRPKKICNRLTLNTLKPSELEVYRGVDCLASLRHNVIDAIGIGLWKLGRR